MRTEIPDIYRDLRRLAAYHLQFERAHHTLRPTDLVHEVYLRMQEQWSIERLDRKQLIGLASTMMRRILVNYAIRRKRQKRGDGVDHIAFDDISENLQVQFGDTNTDLIALDEALIQLAKYDPRQMKIVEYHYFGGFTFDEIAEILNISRSTVMRDWRMARNWLYRKLTYDPHIDKNGK